MSHFYDQDKDTTEIFTVSPERFLEIEEATRMPDPNPVAVHESILSDIGLTPEIDELNEDLLDFLTNHEHNTKDFTSVVMSIDDTAITAERVAYEDSVAADRKAEIECTDAWRKLFYGIDPDEIDPKMAKLLGRGINTPRPVPLKILIATYILRNMKLL